MSMSVGSSEEGDYAMEINTTPLIDVMLVLLIYLIVSLPPATHAVKLDNPPPNQNPPQTEIKPEVIDLEVDFDGTYLWNGTPVASLEALEGFFKQEARKEPQPELHIKPNPRVKYDYVALALAVAQRNEIKRIGFVGNDRYVE